MNTFFFNPLPAENRKRGCYLISMASFLVICLVLNIQYTYHQHFFFRIIHFGLDFVAVKRFVDSYVEN